MHFCNYFSVRMHQIRQQGSHINDITIQYVLLHNYYFQSSTSFHLSINVLKICISKFLQHSYVFKDFWHLRYTHIEYYQIRRDAKRQYAYTLDKPIHCYFDISSHLDRMTNNIIHFYVQRYHWNPSKGWLAIVRLS